MTTETLDQAQEAFQESPSIETAGRLLIQGLAYWHDDMIGDETFGNEVVGPVAHYLGMKPQTVKSLGQTISRSVS